MTHVKLDGRILSERELQALRIADETEGSTSPAQSSPLTHEQEQEIERLAAADKFMRMRRVRELAPTWSEITRSAYARTFAQLSVEFQAAADYCKRYRADDEIPEWLRTGGAS